MKKPNIQCIYDMPADHEVGWKDGLWKALRMLKKDCIIEYKNIAKGHKPSRTGDGLIFWGGSQHKMIPYIEKIKLPKMFLFGGGSLHVPALHAFDIVCVEEDWTVGQMRRCGVKAYKAFGTNTDLFKPLDLPIQWDYIYPGAFALWKCHDVFLEYVRGKGKALAVGYMQPKGIEKETYKKCLDEGVTVLPHVSSDVLVWLLNQSKEVVITAHEFGGGQRSVLEALACKRDINTSLLNERLLSVYEGGLLSHVDYYKALKKYLWMIL